MGWAVLCRRKRRFPKGRAKEARARAAASFRCYFFFFFARFFMTVRAATSFARLP